MAPLPNQVLFIDDDETVREALHQWLTLAGYDVTTFEDPDGALTRIDERFPGILVTDVRMPRIGGLEVLDQALRRDPDLPVLLVTGHGDVAMAVEAMRRGPTTSSRSRSSPSASSARLAGLERSVTSPLGCAASTRSPMPPASRAASSARHGRWRPCGVRCSIWPRRRSTSSSTARPAPARNWWRNACTPFPGGGTPASSPSIAAPSRDDGGERVVRLRGRRLHGCGQAPGRQTRICPSRHAFPR